MNKTFIYRTHFSKPNATICPHLRLHPYLGYRNCSCKYPSLLNDTKVSSSRHHHEHICPSVRKTMRRHPLTDIGNTFSAPSTRHPRIVLVGSIQYLSFITSNYFHLVCYGVCWHLLRCARHESIGLPGSEEPALRFFRAVGFRRKCPLFLPI